MTGRSFHSACRFQEFFAMRDDTPAVPVGPAKQSGVPGLDMTTFSQFIMAIQQAGLSLNVDAIHSVCDREFRDGRYQRAFDVIEGIYLQMNAQVGRRQAELRRQEIQYKSGALKMSPKEWQLRQRRETEQTQKIERARRHCARILDGLNALRAAHAEENKPVPGAPPPAEPTPQA
jgi:hypothetical protein